MTFTATVPDPAPSLSVLQGTWNHEVPTSTAQLDIAVEGTSVSIHGWGNCVPTGCDWGTAQTVNTSGWATGQTIIATWTELASATITITRLSATRLHTIWDFGDGLTDERYLELNTVVVD